MNNDNSIDDNQITFLNASDSKPQNPLFGNNGSLEVSKTRFQENQAFDLHQ
jgi:hypothetical protein